MRIGKAGEPCFIGLRIVCSSVQQLNGEAPSGMYKNRSKSHPDVIVQQLCDSRPGRPGLSVLTSLLASVDGKIY